MKGKMQFQLGRLKADIAGGPYKKIPVGYAGVKLAEEIDAECMIDIPTRDFDVPDEAVFKQGLLKAVMAIHLGFDLYVGCMGGIGRTGLFLAGMAKIMTEYRKKMHRPQFDPVLYVRSQYIPHAVETIQQLNFIRDLDVSSIVQWAYVTQRVVSGTHTFENPPMEMGRDSVMDRFDENIKNDPLFTRSIPKGVELFEQDPEVERVLERMGTINDPVVHSSVDPHYDEQDHIANDEFQCVACDDWFDIEDSIQWADGLACVGCDNSYENAEREHLGDAEKKTGIYVEIDPDLIGGVDVARNDRPLRDAETLERVAIAETDITALDNQTDNQETRIDRLEGCVVELSDQVNKLDSARASDLRECIKRHGGHGRRWWNFWS